MPADLFAGVRVADFEAAVAWYERLFGGPPSFQAHETEVVWEVAEHGWIFVREDAAPGGAEHLVFVDDLDARVTEIAARGIEAAERETYSNGVRKVIYRDVDGNEIGFGGAPRPERG